MAVDQFFTPQWLAQEMVGRIGRDSVRVIADFAAGDGALLQAASEFWPDAQILATDIDRQSVRRLRQKDSRWRVSQCDFLSEYSRRNARSLCGQQGEVDLIVLNPPFSCRGARTLRCQFADTEVTCSTALAFVIAALSYLAPDGEMVALLPQNTLQSDKDRAAWKSVESTYVVNAGRTTQRGDFEGCFVQSRIVRLARRLRKRSNRVISDADRSNCKERGHVTVVRGTVQMHQNEPGTRTLVHTTDLIRNRVILNGHVAPQKRPSVVGPSVLLPRVGQPSIDKISLFLQRRRVVLSDCVIGLQCESTIAATALFEDIIREDADFLRLYSGTCARYTTVARVKGFLRSIGYRTD